MNQSLWNRIRSDLNENAVCQHVLRVEFELYHWIIDMKLHTLDTLKYDPDEDAKCPEYQMVKSIRFDERIESSFNSGANERDERSRFISHPELIVFLSVFTVL